MTESQRGLEDRIRRVLDRAAGQLPVRPVAWRGPPSPARRWLARPNPGSSAALAAAFIALVIAAGATTPYESGFPSTGELRRADGNLIKKITVTPNMITLCGYGC